MVHHFEYTVDYHSDTDSHSDQALEQHNADSIIYAPTPLPDANMFFPDSPALEHNVASASWSAGPYPAQFESIGGATTTHNATPPTDTTTSKPTATSAEPAEQATHSRPRIRSNDLGKYNFNIVDLIIAYNKNPAQTLDQFITTKYPELGAAFLKSQSEDVSSTFAAHAMEVDDDDNDYDDYDENRWENYATGMRDDSDLVPAFHHTLPVTHMDWIERAVDLVYAEPVLLTPNMHQQRNGLVVVGVRCSGNGPGSLNHVRNALETHLDTANPVHADLTPWEKGCLGHTYVVRSMGRRFTMLEETTIMANLIRILNHNDALLGVHFDSDQASVKFLISRCLSAALLVRLEEVIEYICKRSEPRRLPIIVESFIKSDYYF